MVHFVLPILFALTFPFDNTALHENGAYSIAVLSTKKLCSSFLKELPFSRKLLSKLKHESFIIPDDWSHKNMGIS